MARLAIAMSCPHCGGALEVIEGADMLSCPFCSALLVIEGDDGVRLMAFRNVITSEEAVQAAKRWLLDGFIAYDIERKSRIVESFPIYVPFWKLRAMVIGWVCGEDYSDECNAENLRREIPVLEEMEWNSIACDPGGLGITGLECRDGDIVPYVEGNIPVFDVTTSQTEAEAIGLKAMIESATRATGLTNITFRRVDAFTSSMSVLYHPIWIVRYMYHDRMYPITIDGVTGNVLSGRAPDSPLLRCMVLAAGMAAGGFVPLLCVGFLMSLATRDTFALGLAITTVAIPVCIVIIPATYGFFKTERERTCGYVQDNDPPDEPLPKAGNTPGREVDVSYVQGEKGQ